MSHDAPRFAAPRFLARLPLGGLPPVLLAAVLACAVAGCGDVVVGSGDDTAAAADTGGNGGGADVGQQADTAQGTPVTCGSYCTQVMAACGEGGETAQYPNQPACQAFCESWAGLPLGTTTDTSGNTVGCRLYHATVAGQTAPETHCPHAGPTGADTCGSWCDNYCHLALRNCTGEEVLYDDRADCMETCVGFPADGDPGDDAGDSVQCRLHFLALAGTEPPATAARHCPSGAADGGEACIDEPTCEDYCDHIEEVCEPAGHPQYTDEDACLLICRDYLAIPPGEASDTSGNTVGCRMYHTTVATAGSAETHCDHAGRTGGDECGSWCENYCRAAARNCQDLFADAQECMEACEPMADALSDADQRRRFACLIDQLIAAATDPPASVTAHCPDAALDAAQCR